jgi:hypothetical protein
MPAAKIQERVLMCIVAALAALILYRFVVENTRPRHGNGRFSPAVVCRGNLRVVAVAGYQWSMEHSNFMPRTLSELSNEIASIHTMFCPADVRARRWPHRITSWSDLDRATNSYEIINPGISSASNDHIYVHCKIHDIFVYIDGSLLDSNGYHPAHVRPPVETILPRAATNHSR